MAGSFSSGTEQSFTIIDTYNDTITISNIGSGPITKVTATVEGKKAAVAVVPNIGGLEGHWSLNDETDPTADSSGNERHGTLYDNPTWIDGKFDKALEFDGTLDRVLAPNIDSDTITISAWIKQDRSVNFYIVEVAPSYVLRIDTTGAARFLRRDTTLTWISADSAADAVPEDVWTHVAAVDDGTFLRIYVNGQEVDTTDRSGLIWQAGLSQIEFVYSSWWNTYSIGGLDEVHIYNRGLSAGEIKQLYTGLIDAGQSGTIKFITPLSRGSHSARICTPSMCTRGSLMII